jgi:hypothetical protein
MTFESSVHVQPGWQFRLARSFSYTRESWRCWFNGNTNATRVMWVLLCRGGLSERCWPSAPKVRAVVLRHRRSGRARSAAHREHFGPGLEAARARRPWRHDATRARSSAVSVLKVQRAATRGHDERVKGAPYKAETRGAVCKGVSAVRRHAGGLYDAGSYCYALVKCLKLFVRNGKCVIEANDHTQGTPINSEPLVMERTHCNEKRAPKAIAKPSVFGLLSVSLFHFLFC